MAHVAVWTGSEMIVWGGIGDFGQLEYRWRDNPNTDTWTPTSYYQCAFCAIRPNSDMDRKRNGRSGGGMTIHIGY